MHAVPSVLGRSLLVAALFAAGTARADSAFEARGAGSTFVADDARVLGHLGHAGQLRFVWGKDPIVRRSKDGVVLESVVEHQLDTQLVAALGLFDRFEIGAQLSGRVQLAPGAGFAALPSSLSAPAPRLFAKALLVDTGLFQASLRARGALLESIEPGAVLSLDPGWARFTLDLGAAIWPTSTSLVTMPFALNATVPVHERVAVTLDTFGAVTSQRIPLEAMAGARVDLGVVDIVVGVGGGLLADVGTPAVRLTTALAWRFDPVVAVVPAVNAVEPQPVEEVVAAEVVAVVVDTPPIIEAAPVVPAVVAVAEVTVDHTGVTFGDDVVLFPVDRDTLLPDGLRLLEIVAARIKDHPEATRILIEGHADARGDSAFNTELSLWRAEAVRRSLVAAGVAPERLVVRAAGSSRPVAPNKTAAGRRQNRRAEITFESASETP